MIPALTIPTAHHAACRALLAAWDDRNPFDAGEQRTIAEELVRTIRHFSAPREVHLTSGESAASLLRKSLGNASDLGTQP